MKVAGIVLLVLAGLLVVLAVLSGPPGGLMFAMPFIFLMLAILPALLGVVLLVVARLRRGGRPEAR